MPLARASVVDDLIYAQSLCIYTYIYIVYMNIHICIYRERLNERKRVARASVVDALVYAQSLCTYIYIYIYIYSVYIRI